MSIVAPLIRHPRHDLPKPRRRPLSLQVDGAAPLSAPSSEIGVATIAAGLTGPAQTPLVAKCASQEEALDDTLSDVVGVPPAPPEQLPRVARGLAGRGPHRSALRRLVGEASLSGACLLAGAARVVWLVCVHLRMRAGCDARARASGQRLWAVVVLTPVGNESREACACVRVHVCGVVWGPGAVVNGAALVVSVVDRAARGPLIAMSKPSHARVRRDRLPAEASTEARWALAPHQLRDADDCGRGVRHHTPGRLGAHSSPGAPGHSRALPRTPARPRAAEGCGRLHPERQPVEHLQHGGDDAVFPPALRARPRR